MSLPLNLVGTNKKTQDRIRLIYGNKNYMNQDTNKRELFMVGNDPCWTDTKQISPNENSNWTINPKNGIKIFVYAFVYNSILFW